MGAVGADEAFETDTGTVGAITVLRALVRACKDS